jgi:hypothetical protein
MATDYNRNKKVRYPGKGHYILNITARPSAVTGDKMASLRNRKPA